MNAALKNVIAALENGGTHLGDLCFWSLSSASMVRADLESKWNAANLPHQLLPEAPTVQKAFKLAAREAQVGVVDRLIRPVVEDASSVVFAVVHEARSDNGTLSYTQEAKTVLDVRAGSVWSDRPSHELVAAIAARFESLRDTHTADDVRRTITRALASFAAVLLRESGGIWWVPATHARSLRSLQSAIESIGSSRFYLLPVHDTGDASRTLGDAAARSIEVELAELKAEVAAFISAPPERTSTLVRRFDAFDALRARAQLYREVLRVEVQDLDSTLDGLTSSIESMLETKKG